MLRGVCCKPKKPHKCFHVVCRNCGEFQHVNHRCYIQPIREKKQQQQTLEVEEEDLLEESLSEDDNENNDKKAPPPNPC